MVLRETSINHIFPLPRLRDLNFKAWRFRRYCRVTPKKEKSPYTVFFSPQQSINHLHAASRPGPKLFKNRMYSILRLDHKPPYNRVTGEKVKICDHWRKCCSIVRRNALQEFRFSCRSMVNNNPDTRRGEKLQSSRASGIKGQSSGQTREQAS